MTSDGATQATAIKRDHRQEVTDSIIKNSKKASRHGKSHGKRLASHTTRLRTSRTVAATPFTFWLLRSSAARRTPVG
jgi:hypothetical protein